MSDRYFFDKRDMKKALKKYGLIFLCVLPVLIVVNVALNRFLSFWLVTLIDVVIVFLALLVAQLIINAVTIHRAEKLERIKQKKLEQQAEVVVEAEIVEPKQKNKKHKDKK